MQEPRDIVLEHLRHIRLAVDEMRADVKHAGARLHAVERHLAGLVVSDADQYGEIDRLRRRVERIERRLELADPESG